MGGPWGSRGGPWGGLGDPIYYHESVRPSVSADTFFRAPPWGVPGGSLGGPWGSPGGPWALQAPFWSPRSDPDDKGAHSGGSQGRSRKVENHPGSVFWRSQGVKCVYFQGFKHVHFVDLMWPLGAPGPPLGGFGGPWRRQGRSWGCPGGRPGGNDGLLGRSRGVPRDRVPPPRGPRRALWRPNERFEAAVVFPEALESL